MKKCYLFITTILFLFNTQAQDNGSEITYRSIVPDSTIYELTFTVYRDCSSPAMDSVLSGAKISCGSSSSVLIYPKRVSITNVSSLCENPTNQCDPPNTFGASLGLERHVYRDTIDFSVSPYALFYSCTETVIELANCCRTSTSTNFQGNSQAYNYASIFFSNFDSNSNSPTTTAPFHSFPINFGINYVNNQKNPDGDSIVYELAPVLTGSGTVAYNPGFNEDKFHSFYYPGTTSYPYNNPNAVPPIGLYFDETNGDMIFTPTNNPQIGGIVIQATEWRKDSNGIYKKAGITRNERPFRSISSTTNNPPKFFGVPNSIDACIGNDESITIKATDLGFIPPPPTPAFLGDSLSFYVECNYPIVLSTDTSIVASTASVQGSISFNTDSFANVPSSFDIILYAYEAERCYGYNYIPKRITVNLYPKADLSNTISNLGCGKFEIDASIDTFETITSIVSTEIKDTSGKIVHTGFINSAGLDTFQLFESGTYFVETHASFAFACDSILFDTLTLADNDAYPLPKDSIILACYKDQDTLSIPSKWQTGVWSTGDTAHSITVTTDGLYSVEMMDSCGNSTPFTFNVEFREFEFDIADTLVCPNVFVNYTINPIQLLSWTWSDGGTTQFLSTDIAKVHYIDIVDHACGYSFTDSFALIHIDLPLANIVDDTAVQCDNQQLELTVKYDSTYSYLWSTNSMDTTTFVGSPGIYWVDVSNECGTNRDSVVVISDNSPQVDLGNDPIICLGEQDTIGVVANSDYTYSWENGEDSTFRIVDVEQDYILTTSNICGTRNDTIHLFIIDVPFVNLGPDTAKPEFDFITLRNLTPTRFTTSFWNIGSNADTLKVRLSGSYFLTETNQCGTDTDTIVVSYTASVITIENLGISVYPNPASSLFSIKNNSGKPVRATMYNQVGQRVKSVMVDGRYLEVNASDLPKGIYSVQFMVDGINAFSQLILQ